MPWDGTSQGWHIRGMLKNLGTSEESRQLWLRGCNKTEKAGPKKSQQK